MSKDERMPQLQLDKTHKDVCCDLESVVIDLPMKVLAFMKAHEKDLGRSVKEYMELVIIQAVAGDLASEYFDVEVRDLLEQLLK